MRGKKPDPAGVVLAKTGFAVKEDLPPADPDPAREAFLKHPLGGLIIRNALPAIASMLFMALYHMADAMMVGRSLGPDALASVNILYPAENMFTLIIPDHPETIAITLRATSIIGWSLLIMPVGIISSMFFTALERAGSSLLVALSRGLVFTVLGLALFPLFLGEDGIWIAPVFAEVATIFVAGYLIYLWSAKPYRQPEAAIPEPLLQAE